MNNQQYNACGRKMSFDTLWEAETAAARSREQFKREHLEAYKCKYCNHYHTGNQRPIEERKDFYKQ